MSQHDELENSWHVSNGIDESCEGENCIGSLIENQEEGAVEVAADLDEFGTDPAPAVHLSALDLEVWRQNFLMVFFRSSLGCFTLFYVYVVVAGRITTPRFFCFEL